MSGLEQLDWTHEAPTDFTNFKHADMSPEAIDRRLRELAQIYKLGMSLHGAKWLGPISTNTPSHDRDPRSTDKG